MAEPVERPVRPARRPTTNRGVLTTTGNGPTRLGWNHPAARTGAEPRTLNTSLTSTPASPHGRDHRLIRAKNVAKLVQVRRPEKKEPAPLGIGEVRALLEAHRGHRVFPMLVVFALLGLRRSEVLGLKWADIDLEVESLRVVRGIHRVEGTLVEMPTKTKRSRRTIPLPEFVVGVIREHREAQEKERVELAEKWPDLGLVFTSATGRPIDPRNCTRLVQNACENAGVRVVRCTTSDTGVCPYCSSSGYPRGPRWRSLATQPSR